MKCHTEKCHAEPPAAGGFAPDPQDLAPGTLRLLIRLRLTYLSSHYSTRYLLRGKGLQQVPCGVKARCLGTKK
jgi:hypothetical protein